MKGWCLPMLKLIKDSELKELENEVMELREENLKLLREKCNLEVQLFELYGVELEKKLADELELSSQQISKLKLLCSIERARLAGVPEDRILHNIDEITKYFTSGES